MIENLLTIAFYLCFFSLCDVILNSFNDIFVHNLHLIAVYSTHKGIQFNCVEVMEKDVIYHFWQKAATKWLYLSIKNKERLYFYLGKILHVFENCAGFKNILWKENIFFVFSNLSYFLWLWLQFCTPPLKIE